MDIHLFEEKTHDLAYTGTTSSDMKIPDQSNEDDRQSELYANSYEITYTFELLPQFEMIRFKKKKMKYPNTYKNTLKPYNKRRLFTGTGYLHRIRNDI